MVVVREVLSEDCMLSTHGFVLVLDWSTGEVLNWASIGISITDPLELLSLTFFLPWMMCFINLTELWLNLGSKTNTK